MAIGAQPRPIGLTVEHASLMVGDLMEAGEHFRAAFALLDGNMSVSNAALGYVEMAQRRAEAVLADLQAVMRGRGR